MHYAPSHGRGAWQSPSDGGNCWPRSAARLRGRSQRARRCRSSGCSAPGRIGLAAQHQLPAVYFNRLFVEVGGLISYGADTIDPLRRAANYVDRILKGEKPADLPVQAPTKYELVVNLKTAKTLGLDVPTTVLARADEVIE